MSNGSQNKIDELTRDDVFSELKSLVNVFCPFEAVGMVGQEIKHSHYLSYILNPNRPHGFEDKLLHGFLTLVLQDAMDAGERLAMLNLNNAQIRREWKNIDLLIEIPGSDGCKGLIVAIELKINAVESEGQLKKYNDIILRNYLESEWNQQFVFLTKNGTVPQRKTDREIWKPLKLASVVHQLEKDASVAGFFGTSADMLTAYIEMMRRHHMGNPEIKKIAARLWNQHPEALDILMRHKPDLIGDVLKELCGRKGEIAAEMVSQPRYDFVDEKSQKKIHRFSVKSWKQIDGLQIGDQTILDSKNLLVIEIQIVKHEIRIMITMVGGGEPRVRKDFYEKIKKEEKLQGMHSKSPCMDYRDSWIHLTSKTLWSNDDAKDTEVSPEKIVDESVVKRAADFLETTLPVYDKVIGEVFGSPSVIEGKNV